MYDSLAQEHKLTRTYQLEQIKQVVDKLDVVKYIEDGFVESDMYSRFNGQPNSTLQVVAGSNQNEIATAEVVKAYVDDPLDWGVNHAERRRLVPALEPVTELAAATH